MMADRSSVATDGMNTVGCEQIFAEVVRGDHSLGGQKQIEILVQFACWPLLTLTLTLYFFSVHCFLPTSGIPRTLVFSGHHLQ